MKPARRKALIVLAGIALGILVLPLSHIAWDRIALRRYVAELEARGERLSAQSIPVHTQPGARQAALELAGVLQRLPFVGRRNDPTSPMRSVAPGLCLPAEVADPEGEDAYKPARWSELARWLSSSDGDLRIVRTLLERSPVLDFGVSVDRAFDFRLTHLSQIRELGRLLVFSTVHHIHERDGEGATQNLIALLNLIHGLRDEADVLSQQTRLSVTSFALSAVWDFLQSPLPTEEQLASVQAAWSRLTYLAPLAAGIERDRAAHRALFQSARADPARRRFLFQNTFGGTGRPAPAVTGATAATLSGTAEQISASLERSGELMRLWTAETLWAVLWSHDDEYQAIQFAQRYLEVLRTTDRGTAFGKALEDLPLRSLRRPGQDDFTPLSRFISSQVVTSPRSVETALLAEAQRELVCTAIALKRYNLSEHHWPGRLLDLVPSWLPRPPRDPGDGTTLRYKLDPQGRPILYSVGLDGLDQGGDATPPEGSTLTYVTWRGRDLVWPRVATEEEVRERSKALTAKGPGARNRTSR